MQERFEMFTLLIAKSNRLIKKMKTESVEEFNLKSPHVSVLYYLYKSKNGLTSKEICDVCEEDKALISRSIEYLEKEEFIVSSSKSKKKYKCPFVLTGKGFDAAKKLAIKIDNVVKEAGTGLSEEDRKIFYDSLSLICNNLQKILNNYEDKNKI